MDAGQAERPGNSFLKEAFPRFTAVEGPLFLLRKVLSEYGLNEII